MNHFFGSPSSLSNTSVFSSSAVFLVLKKKTTHFELCSLILVLVSSLLTLSLSLPLPLWVSLLHLLLFPFFSTFFLQGKHFHLCYGWRFNTVSPSELEEAWCLAWFFSVVQMDFPPKYEDRNTFFLHLDVPHPSSPYVLVTMSGFCHFLNNLIPHCFMVYNMVMVMGFLFVFLLGSVSTKPSPFYLK